MYGGQHVLSERGCGACGTEDGQPGLLHSMRTQADMWPPEWRGIGQGGKGMEEGGERALIVRLRGLNRETPTDAVVGRGMVRQPVPVPCRASAPSASSLCRGSPGSRTR